MKINCIAVDDEPPAILQLENYIGKIPKLDLLKTFYNASECFDFLKSNKVDIVFLDIEMGDFSGIQLLEGLKEKPLIIFTSAHKSYAHKAFDLDVTDFLVKPISFERFLRAVDKAIDILSMKSPGAKGKPAVAEKDYIFVKANYKMQRVDFRNILYIEGLGEYVTIKTTTEKIITYQSLKNFESLLPHAEFIRVHKSYLARLDKIDSVEGQSLKISGNVIPIGEKFRKKLFEIISVANR